MNRIPNQLVKQGISTIICKSMNLFTVLEGGRGVVHIQGLDTSGYGLSMIQHGKVNFAKYNRLTWMAVSFTVIGINSSSTTLSYNDNNCK